MDKKEDKFMEKKEDKFLEEFFVEMDNNLY